MRRQIQLIGTGPGRGFFEISGLDLVDDAIEVAIQRNADDRFLGPDLGWQASIHWHWCPRLDAESGTVRLSAGPEIVDGVIGSAVNALMVEVRGGDLRESAILRLRGLVGSPAAGAARPHPEDSAIPETRADPAVQIPPVAEDRPDPRHARLQRPLIAGALALAALAAAWYAGLLTPEPAGEAPSSAGETARPDRQAPAEQEDAPPSPEPSAPAQVEVVASRGADARAHASAGRGLTGRAMVQGFLESGPSAEQLLSEAEARERDEDCEAAILLYERAASSSPLVAASVAARYDPTAFEASTCIEQPSIDSAIVWYQDAARAGDPMAQRRLGELLVAHSDSGVLHEEGRDWLRKAAAAGDEQAKRALEALGPQ